MMKKLTPNEAADFLKSQEELVILTHKRPDGDTVGCAGLLCRALRKVGKRAYVLDNPELTPKYRPYLEGLTCKTFLPGQTLVSVDVAAENMFPVGAEALQGQAALLLDHHGSNTGFAARGIVRPEAAACAELILEVAEALGADLDREMAACAYVALSTDTGCFRYANTTANTLRAAAVCLDAGVDTYAINKVMFETVRFARLRLNAYLTEHMAFYGGGTVALCKIPLEVERGLGVESDDLDDISSFPRNIEGVQIAATLRTTGSGGTKLSLRAAPGYDASKICGYLGGGGHPGAAGAFLDCGQDEAAERILEAMKRSGISL